MPQARLGMGGVRSVPVGCRRARVIVVAGLLSLAGGLVMAGEDFYRGGTIPARAPRTSPSLVDLSAYYTAPLDNDWLVSAAVNLKALPKGVQTLAGTPFDVRGIVQLASTELLSQSVLSDGEKARQYPRAARGIPVRLQARRIHFLHASAWNAGGDERIGEYVVHYADGTQQSIPLLYGRTHIDWWVKTPADKPSEAEVAWHGSHSRSPVSLYKYTWTNPSPGKRLDAIDFVSAMARAAPFLIAASCEPVTAAPEK